MGMPSLRVDVLLYAPESTFGNGRASAGTPPLQQLVLVSQGARHEVSKIEYALTAP